MIGTHHMQLGKRTPLIRPREDFGVRDRSTVSLHTGPTDLALHPSGETLYVLNRFTREIVVVSIQKKGRRLRFREESRIALPATTQNKRARGEVLYYTDLGNTRMTCDTCHPDGRTGGMLFTKGRPMRIYRSPNLRASRETAPYFTPSMLQSLHEMARDVLARNRFQNPKPTGDEIKALAHYTSLLTFLPNPFLSRDGSLPEKIAVTQEHSGSPSTGRLLFKKLGCATSGCHPPPQFSGDADLATRGRLFNVGTPLALPLRTQLQDMDPYDMPPPSLHGVWDNWPLLMSGAAGYKVEGGQLVVSDRNAIWSIVDGAGPAHGNSKALVHQEKVDLTAYLMTL